MKIKQLSDIFTFRFSKKTTSTLKDESIPILLKLYCEDHATVSEIAKLFTANRKIIERILHVCLTEEEFKLAKSQVYSRSVNKEERKNRQITAQKKAYNEKCKIGWQHPMKDPDVIKRAITKRSANISYKPHKNFGNCAGRANGRYKPIISDKASVLKSLLVNSSMTLNSVAKFTQINPFRIRNFAIESGWFTTLEFEHRTKKSRQTYPEAFFETLLQFHNIEYKYNFTIRSGKRRPRYDFLIIKLNILIELDCPIWHDYEHCINIGMPISHLEKIKNAANNDAFKTQLAHDSKFELIRIIDVSNESLQTCVKSLVQHLERTLET